MGLASQTYTSGAQPFILQEVLNLKDSINAFGLQDLNEEGVGLHGVV